MAEFGGFTAFFRPANFQELVYECDLLSAKEGQSKSVLDDFHAQEQATNRYILGALVVTEPVLEVLRRELRRTFPDVKIDTDQLRIEFIQEVLKREITEGEKADDARRRISKAQGRTMRAKGKGVGGNGADSDVPTDVPAPAPSEPADRYGRPRYSGRLGVNPPPVPQACCSLTCASLRTGSIVD